MLLRVDLPEGPFVADVGFGGEGCVLPVSFEAQGELASHRVVREGGESWVLQAHFTGAWTDLYAFTLEPQLAVDYEMANHFTSTYPRSPFVLNLTAQRAQRRRRTILRNRDLVVHEGGRVQTSTVRDADHLLEVLAGEFDLVFGAETRFARPDFS
jgi:N-hydroxyarylamine O-acetyltransferase